MKYEVDLTENGVTSAIDTIDAPENYTATDYILDCEANADQEWCDMLKKGQVTLIPVD